MKSILDMKGQNVYKNVQLETQKSKERAVFMKANHGRWWIFLYYFSTGIIVLKHSVQETKETKKQNTL